MRQGLWRLWLVGSVLSAFALLAGGAGTALAARVTRGAAARQVTRNATVRSQGETTSVNHGVDDSDLADQQAQYDYERTAPAPAVSGDALLSASQQAAGLPTAGGAWQEFTSSPFNAQPASYTDPFWSNVGAGFSIVGGRTTALAQTPDGTWFAGTANGGVWRSADQGRHWTPVFDTMPSLSIGALAVDPADGSLWVGTGEANLSQDSYAGTGVYRSTNDGATFRAMGADSTGTSPLASHTIFRLDFDPHGDAYAATDNGLFRLPAGGVKWSEVLDPAGPTDFPPYDQQVTSVAVVPGTNGSQVIAVIGFRGPGNTKYNGFYQSTDSGRTFAEVKLRGAIDASDIGRTTFTYAADGKKLYAIVESPAALTAGAVSVLQGIYVSTGNPASVAGPWVKIADAKKLSNSGSANAYGPNSVGAQAWYNQDLAVDPLHDNHVYAGLEEVFESTNGGGTWVTASQYWNYGLACSPNCPNTTHPDQHAMMIADDKIVIGNDGGVYSRPLSDTQQYGDWTDLNATLRSMQYYDARAGALGQTGEIAAWGGLQDNGTSFTRSGAPQTVEPAGGDGFDVIVDPKNANRMTGEYVDGATYTSTDGGHSFANTSPTCPGQETEYGVGNMRPGCDPGPRFVTPLVQDGQNANTWLLGGEFVWVTKSGWSTTCPIDPTQPCSWHNVFDTGAGHAVTALSSANNGQIIYAAWVGGGGNPGPAFSSGIATNYGGTWHQVSTAGLPNRYIAGVTVDPSNPAHAYAVFNGYSRRWIPGGGLGHVFETTDGGASWTDISGNLPDAPGDALVLNHGQLALATDIGMFTAAEGGGAGTQWSRLGTGLPNTSDDDVTLGPDGDLYVATHGRGIWRTGF
jgi:sugar lactone lactonase YvrE